MTGSVTSSGGSVNVDKLGEAKSNLEKAFEEMVEAHRQLVEAVEKVGQDELVGYEDTYSKEALEGFRAEYTDKCQDIVELLEEKIEELGNVERFEDVRDVNSAFNDDASS